MPPRSHSRVTVDVQSHWDGLRTFSTLPILLMVRPTAAPANVEVAVRAEETLRMEAASPVLPLTVSRPSSCQAAAKCML